MKAGAAEKNRLSKRYAGKQGMLSSPLADSLSDNLQAIRTEMGAAADLVVREFRLGTGCLAAVVLVDGLVKSEVVDNFILRPLSGLGGDQGAASDQAGISMAQLKGAALSVADVKEAATLGELISGILNGSTALLVEGHALALLASTIGWQSRQVSESTVENVVRGPREAFTEDLTVSISAVRRRIRNPRLRVEKLKLGEVTHTAVALLYVEGLAKEQVLGEVRSRLGRICIDGILDSGYIEELIEDNRASPFPQVEHTERPDKVSGALLEGRVAILTDGTPNALLVPVGLYQFLQSSEDYYERYPIALFVRAIRIMGVLAALFLPSFFVAVTTYHQEMIPLGLALNLAGSREGSPFPAFVEAMLMEITFEVLREAGLRLPRPVGQALSIVGGLVIGDTAVRTGLASPAMVIVVAATGMASFTIPAFNLAISLRMLRFPIMMIAAVAGLPGMTLTALTLVCHMVGLKSFGVPYLSPLVPAEAQGWKDTVMRVPWWSMLRRPRQTAAEQKRQQPPGSRRGRGGG